MFLHLGASVVVHESDILGIFDLDNTTYSHKTREFLSGAESMGQVISIGDDLPKSFILCRGQDGRDIVYLSQLSSATLLKRVESGSLESF